MIMIKNFSLWVLLLGGLSPAYAGGSLSKGQYAKGVADESRVKYDLPFNGVPHAGTDDLQGGETPHDKSDKGDNQNNLSLAQQFQAAVKGAIAKHNNHSPSDSDRN